MTFSWFLPVTALNPLKGLQSFACGGVFVYVSWSRNDHLPPIFSWRLKVLLFLFHLWSHVGMCPVFSVVSRTIENRLYHFLIGYLRRHEFKIGSATWLDRRWIQLSAWFVAPLFVSNLPASISNEISILSSVRRGQFSLLQLIGLPTGTLAFLLVNCHVQVRMVSKV